MTQMAAQWYGHLYGINGYTCFLFDHMDALDPNDVYTGVGLVLGKAFGTGRGGN